MTQKADTTTEIRGSISDEEESCDKGNIQNSIYTIYRIGKSSLHTIRPTKD